VSTRRTFIRDLLLAAGAIPARPFLDLGAAWRRHGKLFVPGPSVIGEWVDLESTDEIARPMIRHLFGVPAAYRGRMIWYLITQPPKVDRSLERIQ